MRSLQDFARMSWIIAKREFAAYFASPLAGVFLTIFVAATGAFAFYIGGFFDRYASGWDEADVAWYELVVEEDDVDIMAWALGTGHPPAHLDNPPLIAAMRRLDYIPLP